MRKKWLAMGAGIGIGSVMLLASGFTAAAGSSGYDVYKTAWKHSLAVSSVTGNVDISVTDNEAKLLGIATTFKANREQHAASAAVRADTGSVTHALNVYRQEDKTIIKPADSEVYRVIEGAGPHWRHGDGKPSGPPDGLENVIDALAGKLRDQFTVEDGANGGKHVSLHLTGDQVPVAVNALSSFIMKQASDGHWKADLHHEPDAASASAAPKVPLPKLTQDVRVQEIELDATIDADNYIDRETANIVIVGNDKDGASHEVAINLAVDLSGQNRTVPDTVSLDGKQVETIQADSMKQRKWH